MTDKQAAELAKPCIGSFNDPAAFVAPQFPAIVISPFFVVGPVRGNQFDAPLLPSFAKRIGVIAAVGDYPFWFLPRPVFGPWDADLLERGVRKRNFCRRGTFQPNSQRNTLTVSQYYPLCAFAALAFADPRRPFLAAAKLPSRKASSHRSSPSASKFPNNALQARNQTPCSYHCFSRRQHVEGEGYSAGRNRHAAPVCRIHRMPSKHARLDAHGRPRLSFRRRGLGNGGSINSQCSSVNCLCRFLMTEAQQFTCLTLSHTFEAEPIYETSSSQDSMISGVLGNPLEDTTTQPRPS